MTYTDDQIRAIDGLLSWVKSPDDYLATLNGAAGTGKTTSAKAFINGLPYRSNQIGVSAPTHKAKKVIESSTGYVGETIQKILGLRPNIFLDNFNPNRPVFSPMAKESIQYYKVLLIDEASMINKFAFDLIEKLAIKYGVKVLFLGDEYQLPPIGETISKVFSSVKNVFTLEQIVRQENTNPMFDVLGMLRNDVKNNTENGVKHLITTQRLIKGDSGYMCLSNSVDNNSISFGDKLLEYYYSTEYTVNTDHMKFIAYTNDSVEEWSNAIRNKLLKIDASTIINVGEDLLGYNSIMTKQGNMILQNSEDYKIESIQHDVSRYGIEGYTAVLTTPEGGQTTVFIVDTNNEANFEAFREIVTEKYITAKAKNGSAWTTYYNFKNNHLVLIDVYLKDKPKTYYNQICKKDLYYNYGLTTHKSQGSTYDNVSVNLINMYLNKKIAERNRLIYVAASRAKYMNLILTKKLI